MEGHISVLLNECIEYLNIKPNGIYVDATLGGAGHSLKICERLNENGRLIGIDADKCAIERAETELAAHKDKVILCHSNFSDIKEVLDQLKIDTVDGILMDLGVSSYQLDEAYRGFSYMHDAKLDMRMDIDKDFSAYDVVNDYDENQLAKIIKDYGEERWAVRIAKFIVSERKDKPIETTFELVSTIKRAIPKGAREDGPHPAKRTFQAIRIEVNNELGILKDTVTDGFSKLSKSGRMCIITFHSLEDRIIKNIYRQLESPCVCPTDFPVCACGKKAIAKVVTRKPILPSQWEIENNHRSRSAKLRVAEKAEE